MKQAKVLNETEIKKLMKVCEVCALMIDEERLPKTPKEVPEVLLEVPEVALEVLLELLELLDV